MSRLEFAYILKRLGEPLTDEEVDEILDHFDRDGSGEIDFDGTLKAKRGFGQGFSNWLKLSNMVQQGPGALITNYCAYPSNRNKLVEYQN